MFEFDRRQITPDSSGLQRHSSRTYMEQAHRAAHGSFHRARMRGSLRWLWNVVTGRSGHLLDLERMTASCIIRGQHAAGSQPVLLSQIVGSEGRAQEFDHTFAPLKNHTKQRWITIATMMELGEALPLVTLVQVGDSYFVRDGHHRVSVARALGYAYIDANVTVWDVVDTAACGCRSAAQQLA